MRSAVIEMSYPRLQNELEMTLVEWNEEVQTFAAQCPAETFAYRIRFRRPDWCSQHVHAHSRDLFVHVSGEDAVPVVNHESIRMVAGERLAELLQGPIRGRVCGDIVMKDSSRLQIQDREDV